MTDNNILTQSQVWFKKAIAAGFLSEDKSKMNYVGNYMYMGMSNNKIGFKHGMLRVYINIDVNLLS